MTHKPRRIVFVIAALTLSLQADQPGTQALRPTTLDALTPLASWAKLAPGIWRAKAGDTSRELR